MARSIRIAADATLPRAAAAARADEPESAAFDDALDAQLACELPRGLCGAPARAALLAAHHAADTQQRQPLLRQSAPRSRAPGLVQRHAASVRHHDTLADPPPTTLLHVDCLSHRRRRNIGKSSKRRTRSTTPRSSRALSRRAHASPRARPRHPIMCFSWRPSLGSHGSTEMRISRPRHPTMPLG